VRLVAAVAGSFDEAVTTQEYHDHLSGVAQYLSQRGIEAECRGDASARFVYAHQAGRAVELSWDGVGVFIEMFEEPSEVSMRDEQQDSFQIGVERALAWLMRTE
jgi:hypothetical protein